MPFNLSKHFSLYAIYETKITSVSDVVLNENPKSIKSFFTYSVLYNSPLYVITYLFELYSYDIG